MKSLFRRSYMMFMACGVFVCMQTKAQRISAGLEFALPNEGDALEDVVVAGFGLSARYENGFTKNWSWLADGGFILFTGKNEGDPILTVPVLAGVKCYLQEDRLGFYGQAQLGVHSFFGGAEAHGTNFSYAPGIGYRFKKLDVGARYEKIVSSWISASYIGLRVGCVFRGK